MDHTLNVELFFFNANTDYLPHYNHFTCTLEEKASVKDLLKNIQQEREDFQYPKNKTLIQINSVLIDARMKIKDIVNEFGNTIRIDPASTYRATKDLRFNDDDFMQKYALLEPYCDEEDLKYYRTLYLNYYGSEALHYNQDYFGDSFFLLADRLLQNANEHSDAILNIISDEHNGFGLYEFENNCFPSYDITATIEALKERIEARRFINSEQMSEAKSFIEKIKAKFFTKAPKADPQSSSVEILGNTYKVQKAEDMSELEFLCKTITLQNLSKDIKHSFAEFNIAFYFGPLAHKETLKDADSLLSCVGANSVTFSLSTKSCGFNILSSAPQIAYKKAGAILLDAQDSNVDILVVDSKEAMKMLNSNLKKCEEAMGREIDIQIITPSQLVAIATGTTEKKALGFDKKGSKITFI